VERLPEVFARKADHDAESAKERERELFEEIGRLQMELEWLKGGTPPVPYAQRLVTLLS